MRSRKNGGRSEAGGVTTGPHNINSINNINNISSSNNDVPVCVPATTDHCSPQAPSSPPLGALHERLPSCSRCPRAPDNCLFVGGSSTCDVRRACVYVYVHECVLGLESSVVNAIGAAAGAAAVSVRIAHTHVPSVDPLQSSSTLFVNLGLSDFVSLLRMILVQ